MFHRLWRDVTLFLLRQQKHRNQRGPLARVQGDQVFESIFCFSREHRIQDSLSFPLESAFFPDVDIASENSENEKQHFQKTEEFEVPVDHGPWKEKDGLNVEQQKEHGDQIELHRE